MGAEVRHGHPPGTKCHWTVALHPRSQTLRNCSPQLLSVHYEFGVFVCKFHLHVNPRTKFRPAIYSTRGMQHSFCALCGVVVPPYGDPLPPSTPLPWASEVRAGTSQGRFTSNYKLRAGSTNTRPTHVIKSVYRRWTAILRSLGSVSLVKARSERVSTPPSLTPSTPVP